MVNSQKWYLPSHSQSLPGVYSCYQTRSHTRPSRHSYEVWLLAKVSSIVCLDEDCIASVGPLSFGREALQCPVNKAGEMLLVRFMGDNWVDALVFSIVRGDLLMEMEGGSVVFVFLKNGDTGVVA